MRIWTGVYAEAQAERGKATFAATCSTCHRGDLSGEKGPALAGPKFMARWELETLNKMFQTIKVEMPRSDPGSLSETTVTDVMAFILKSNGFPAAAASGTTLSADGEALEAIVFVPQSGPTKIPNFALVQVAGCLTRRPGNAWALTRASDPLSTRDAPATDAELQEAAGRIPGNETFRLVSAGPFKPETYVGEKVHLKGIINRTQPDVLLNVIALRPLGGACTN